MKKRRWTTIILLISFFIGLSVALYPSLSNYWNSLTQSEAIVDYEKMLQSIPKEDYSKYFAKAEEYNEQLKKLDYPLIEYNTLQGYDELLNLTGNGMMGYVSIGKIGIELPLYHGTSDAVLSTAIGHLKGSSLPVGGLGTHIVVSAHRGLPSAKLFTDLDRMELGDTFQITILDRIIIYQVDQIRIVEPDDLSLLGIEQDKEYCTLLTCTPYGINTQRLLVRGVRVDSIQQKNIYITADGYKVDTLIVTPVVALPMLLVLILIVFFKPVKKQSKIK
ncbi:MAG: class C sortase [Ruminococcaceae bacterium]|nr:class C sortase [Oscillospiraceae bacterium]